MKTLKKALSIILCLALMLSCVVGMQISASAEEETGETTSDIVISTNTECNFAERQDQDGYFADLDVFLDGATSFASLGLKFQYDSSVVALSYVSDDHQNLNANFSYQTSENQKANPYTIVWYSQENLAVEARKIAFLNFKYTGEGEIPEDFATTVTVTPFDPFDQDGNELNLNAESFTVNFLAPVEEECAHENAEWTITTHPTVDANGEKQLICPDCPEDSNVVETAVVPRLLKFRAVNPRLESGIALVYKVNAEYFTSAGFTNPFIKFVVDGETSELHDFTIEPNGSKYDYVFVFKGLKPQQMKEDVVATVCAYYGDELCEGVATYNGTKVNGSYTTSILSYSLTQLKKASSTAELKVLLVDMLNYGAAMQTYTEYKTDALVNEDAGLADYLSLATTTTPAMESIQNTTFKTVDSPSYRFGSVALRLTDSVKFLLRIENADKSAIASTEGITVVAEADDNNDGVGDRTFTITPDTFELREDGKHNIVFDGMAAKEFRTAVYFTIYKDGVAVSNTLSYHVETYCSNESKKTTNDPNLRALVVAVMKYGDSAAAYLN